MSALTKVEPQFDEKRIELIRKTIANGAPPLEFELFVGVCQRTGLDPLAKQIYFIQRGGKWSWQTSIDGYRLVADRTGKYAGSDDPVYDATSGPPTSATVTVWKLVQGVRCPFTATARWTEYVQDKSPMWQRMPFLMLGKCAESLALRKAFPAELSGLYTQEEMMQADTVDTSTGEILGRNDSSSVVSAEDDEHGREMRRMFAVANTAQIDDALLKALCIAVFPHIESRKEMTADELRQMSAIIEHDLGDGSPLLEYTLQILDAETVKDLNHYAKVLKSAGISTPWLQAIWLRRKKEIEAAPELASA